MVSIAGGSCLQPKNAINFECYFYERTSIAGYLGSVARTPRARQNGGLRGLRYLMRASPPVGSPHMGSWVWAIN